MPPCDKNRPPPEYKKDHNEKCKLHFALIKTRYPKRMKNVDKMYVIGENGKEEICYNPEMLSKFGWCYLLDFPEKHEQKDWKGGKAGGICCPSCEKVTLDQVTNLYISKNILCIFKEKITILVQYYESNIYILY